MFPPVDASILRDNPEFAKLHTHLTTVVLHPDGSTKHDPAAQEHDKIRDELKKYCVKAAKQHLLTRAIETVSPPQQQTQQQQSRAARSSRQAPSSMSLPEPLLDLLLLLPPLLDPENPLPSDASALLLASPPLSDLDSHLPDLGALLSAHLRSQALDLARIVHPSTNPSYLHRHIPTLAESLASLADRETDARLEATTARLATLTSLSALLGSQHYDVVISLLIRALEAKHGPVARATELDAALVAISARQLDGELQSTLRTLRGEVYSPSAVAALTRYAAHLRDAKTRVRERLRGLEAELGEYGVGVEGGADKERMMREMARVHREMGREIQDANTDLDRLRRG